MEREITMYDKKVFGVEVSEYGLENGYLDYRTLGRMLEDVIPNNDIYEYLSGPDLEVVHGDMDKYDDVSQYFIISKYGANILKEYTDHIVYYHYDANLYIWGVPYFGTAWNYVLTDIRLIDGDA